MKSAVDTMKTVIEIAQNILKSEGGYVNDPDDPGGPTKWGVTLKTLQRLRRDITGDGRVDLQDVRALTPEHAIEIFVQEYFYRLKINKLPIILHPSVFDMNVNAGTASIIILQSVLSEFGQNVTRDGIIGFQTITAANSVAQRAPDHLVDAYGIARRDHYLMLADRRPSLRKFARTRTGEKGGWIKRTEQFMTPKYHLSEVNFAKRTAKWPS